ncbi:MAG: IS1 family transposase [Candidatus Bathyarchaeota archaeon]|nr:IS1 family transposase [Candidatus Termiticorpusculum sp.]
MAFCGFKKNKLWILKAIDRGTRRVVAWVLGNSDTATFRRLYNKVKHLENCVFYTDDWDVFAKVLPKERHVIGKAHTVTIEQNNSNTRHHLGRFTRRTKVVSKKSLMVDLTLRLWCALSEPETFKQWQKQTIYIFR